MHTHRHLLDITGYLWWALWASNLLHVHTRCILTTGMCVSTHPDGLCWPSFPLVECSQNLCRLPSPSELLPYRDTLSESYSFNNWFLTAITLTWTQPSPQNFLREAEHDCRPESQEDKPKNPLKEGTTLSYCWGWSQSPSSLYLPWGKISGLLWWFSCTCLCFPCISASWQPIHRLLKNSYLIIWYNNFSLASFLLGEMHLNVHCIWHHNTNSQGRITTGVIHLW